MNKKPLTKEGALRLHNQYLRIKEEVRIACKKYKIKGDDYAELLGHRIDVFFISYYEDNKDIIEKLLELEDTDNKPIITEVKKEIETKEKVEVKKNNKVANKRKIKNKVIPSLVRW